MYCCMLFVCKLPIKYSINQKHYNSVSVTGVIHKRESLSVFMLLYTRGVFRIQRHQGLMRNDQGLRHSSKQLNRGVKMFFAGAH